MTMHHATRWMGRLLTVTGLAAWLVWLGWRVQSPVLGVVSIVELLLELVAFLAAVTVATGLWSWQRDEVAPFDRRSGTIDVTGLADALELHGAQRRHGADDTGEVACARRGLALVTRRGGERPVQSVQRTAALLAVEGLRRTTFVAVLVVVLISGRFPFEIPPPGFLAALVCAQVALAVGFWLLSAGGLRPGARAAWSMGSVGAGVGDGHSRTGLPIRWATTMGTIIVVNLAVALRGFSDRWTHGLGSLTRDERLLAMGTAWWLVAAGLLALRTLPQPARGLHESSRQLEETSARRMALGGAVAVAVIGCLAGMLPGAVPA